MPKLDGTGPNGQGARTGRSLGKCGGGTGRGCGCRGGMGINSRRFISPKNELAALEEEEKMLEEDLALIKEEKEVLLKQK